MPTFFRRRNRRFEQGEYPAQNVDPRVVDWMSRVTRNGGAAPTLGFQLALSGFYQDISAAGLWAKMVSICVPVAGNIIATATPVIFQGGLDPWIGVGAFTNSDVGINGLQGNGVDFFNTGIIPANTAMTSTSAGLVVYVSIDSTTASQQEIGCSGAAFDSQFSLNPAVNSGSASFLCWRFDAPNILTWTPQGAGFYTGQRTASNAFAVYYAKSTTAFTTLASGSTAQTGSIETAQGISFMALNNNGPVANISRKCVSFGGATTGLTSTDSQNLYNAVQRMLMAKGGGYV